MFIRMTNFRWTLATGLASGSPKLDRTTITINLNGEDFSELRLEDTVAVGLESGCIILISRHDSRPLRNCSATRRVIGSCIHR